MVGENDKSKVNKGVNATSESFPDTYCMCNDSDTEASTFSASTSTSVPNYKSLNKVKTDLQNAIDLMGPDTPQVRDTTTLTENSTSEAHNDSYMSTEPITSEIFKEEYTYPSESSAMVVPESVIATPAVSIPCTFSNIPQPQVQHYCNCPAAAEPFCVNQTCPNLGYNSQIIPKPVEVCGNVKRDSRAYCKKGGIVNWIKKNSFERFSFFQRKTPCELYKMNIAPEDDHGPPKRLIFDLVDGIPKPDMANIATSTRSIEGIIEMQRNCQYNYSQPNKASKNEKNRRQRHDKRQKRTCFNSNGDAKVDFYYFDHGNAQYFNTTDNQHIVICEILAEKTERYTTQFWAEIFATIHLGFSFFISFILQLFKFLMYGILRPLTVGIMQLGSDYFLKPFLTTLFNGIIQPFLIFCYNIATSLRDLCDPIAEGIGYFFRECSVLCRSIRLCSYKRNGCDSPRECPHK